MEPKISRPHYISQRDGASQAARTQAALDPDYVAVDERSLRDLLAFARAYASELRYVSPDGATAGGDWRAFIPDVLDLDAVMAFMDDPKRVSAEQARLCSRPHFALFLTFLQLLRHTQAQMNTLTSRHLDFYYRQVLLMSRRGGTPDRVHVLVDLAPASEPFLLPAGTLLDAGKGGHGQALGYATDQDLIVTRAQVARLSTVYQDKKTWLNLSAAADARANQVTTGIEGDADSPRWHTFGQMPAPVAASGPPPVSLGWAISTPALALSQGTRTITLTLVFEAKDFAYARVKALFPGGSGAGPFQLDVSSTKGWIEPLKAVSNEVGYVDDPDNRGSQFTAADTLRPGAQPAMRFTLTFSPKEPALTPPDVKYSKLMSEWPVLRLRLRQIWQQDPAAPPAKPPLERYACQYRLLQTLVLHALRVQVAVEGLTPLQLQNDEGGLAPNRPFLPFGSAPMVGSRFYLGHPELVTKQVETLTFKPEWMGKPADLKKHYTNYPDVVGEEPANPLFTTCISLAGSLLDKPLPGEADADLFPAGGNITITPKDWPTPGPADAVDARADLTTWPRYLRWELNPPDFQHEAYPAVVARKSFELVTAMAEQERLAWQASKLTQTSGEAGAPASVDPATYQVNPPYTPKLKSLLLDYTAADAASRADDAPGRQTVRLFHLHPFGHAELPPLSAAAPPTLLPAYENEGELYIGLRDVQPPQNLSLLWQMAEGSADPDVDPAPVVQWSYLSANEWKSFVPGDVLQDATLGLRTSGIVAFALPPVAPSTLLDPDLYWLRAAVGERSAGVCDTIAMQAQAVSATFVMPTDAAPEQMGNEALAALQDHLRQPLPAATIKGLVEREPVITGVRQPYGSFGGAMPEPPQGFYQRASERVRHKDRALTMWDYEQLVLERFPQIHKAKCLPADPAHSGQVTLIVIPDIRHQQPFDPFAPKAAAGLLADIERYLTDKAPAYVTIKVRNPSFVPVTVRLAVHFKAGYDQGFYIRRLNDELNRYLSPWAYAEGADIVIGGRIYANLVVDFVESQPYIDHVAMIELCKGKDGVTAQPVPGEGEAVGTEQPYEVLVAARKHDLSQRLRHRLLRSAPYEVLVAARKHDIRVLGDGISSMRIEVDFVVGEDEPAGRTYPSRQPPVYR